TELTKNVVLPELVELARDEGSSVRLAAFETLVNLLIMFDHEDRSQIVLPLVKSFCEKSFKADESILASLSLQLGKLCHGLQGIFTQEQHMWFLEFYRKLCRLGLHQENGHNDNQIQNLELEKKYLSVRKNCAYNFPAMIMFVGCKSFHIELYATFFCLCHDPDVPVRYTMAVGFYEVRPGFLLTMCYTRCKLYNMYSNLCTLCIHFIFVQQEELVYILHDSN
ncbi:hypothetical protein FKM82_019988, partial [Ascaphus truei]